MDIDLILASSGNPPDGVGSAPNNFPLYRGQGAFGASSLSHMSPQSMNYEYSLYEELGQQPLSASPQSLPVGYGLTSSHAPPAPSTSPMSGSALPILHMEPTRPYKRLKRAQVTSTSDANSGASQQGATSNAGTTVNGSPAGSMESMMFGWKLAKTPKQQAAQAQQSTLNERRGASSLPHLPAHLAPAAHESFGASYASVSPTLDEFECPPRKRSKGTASTTTTKSSRGAKTKTAMGTPHAAHHANTIGNNANTPNGNASASLPFVSPLQHPAAQRGFVPPPANLTSFSMYDPRRAEAARLLQQHHASTSPHAFSPQANAAAAATAAYHAHHHHHHHAAATHQLPVSAPPLSGHAQHIPVHPHAHLSHPHAHHSHHDAIRYHQQQQQLAHHYLAQFSISAPTSPSHSLDYPSPLVTAAAAAAAAANASTPQSLPATIHPLDLSAHLQQQQQQHAHSLHQHPPPFPIHAPPAAASDFSQYPNSCPTLGYPSGYQSPGAIASSPHTPTSFTLSGLSPLSITPLGASSTPSSLSRTPSASSIHAPNALTGTASVSPSLTIERPPVGLPGSNGTSAFQVVRRRRSSSSSSTGSSTPTSPLLAPSMVSPTSPPGWSPTSSLHDTSASSTNLGSTSSNKESHKFSSPSIPPSSSHTPIKKKKKKVRDGAS